MMQSSRSSLKSNSPQLVTLTQREIQISSRLTFGRLGMEPI
jgi:hypothetical protein